MWQLISRHQKYFSAFHECLDILFCVTCVLILPGTIITVSTLKSGEKEKVKEKADCEIEARLYK